MYHICQILSFKICFTELAKIPVLASSFVLTILEIRFECHNNSLKSCIVNILSLSFSVCISIASLFLSPGLSLTSFYFCFQFIKIFLSSWQEEQICGLQTLKHLSVAMDFTYLPCCLHSISTEKLY